ncbi:hypothetical protein Sliba_29720 [Streptomyces nigrescens]|uniref:Uncharacterized protein n=1 Tax=Streptomyces nigrescens TaxID=1920 RepID=A0A640TFZ5_STRNI|nr:hypothetical protein Sliba_29720 [Streptomyces libani subsp. libani]GGV91118.1 hypothetical protein GCM10010500_20520 [Streptomyces libani subsp. libani]
MGQSTHFTGAPAAVCSRAPGPAGAGGAPLPGAERGGSRVTVSRNIRVTGGFRPAVAGGGR